MKNEKAENLEECFQMLRMNIPSTCEDYSKYHVHRGSCYSVEEILTTVELTNSAISLANRYQIEDSCKILFTGQRGIGKTTELHAIETELKDKLHIIFINAQKDELNFDDFQYADVLIVLLKEVFDSISNEEKVKNHQIINNIESILIQILDECDYEIPQNKKNSLTIKWLFEIISKQLMNNIKTREKLRESIQRSSTEVITLFNEVVKVIEKEKKKRIMIIIDDLEKVTDYTKIERLLLTNKNIILKLKCNFIFTIPPTLKFSKNFIAVKEIYEDELFLSLFEIFNSDKEINSGEIEEMCNVVRKRVNPGLLEENAIKLAALYSGGVISTMLSMCATSCIKAITNSSSSVNTELIHNSFNRLREEYGNTVAGLGQESVFQRVHKIKKLDNTIDNSHNLFISAILLYKNINSDKTWCDTNPALWPNEEIESIKKKVDDGEV